MSTKRAIKAWGIRAGKSGRAHDLFIDVGCIALEDTGLGDLSKLKADREAFLKAFRKENPQETRISSAGICGKFLRFIHEIRVGDLVLYPALADRQVYVGEITGGYVYVAASEYPHQRTVKWRYIIPKSELSEAARYELGAARTFFQFKRNMNELISKTKELGVTRFDPKTKRDLLTKTRSKHLEY